MSKTYRATLVGLPLFFALIVFAMLAILLGFPSRRKSMPNPNGYEDFVKAGRQVTGDIGSYQELDHSALNALVSANSEPLRILRVGLAETCRMPVDAVLANMTGLTGEMTDMKHLAQLLSAEGRLHELESQPGDAASSYTDAIRLGNEMSRGALLITRLVGISCESIGCRGLAKLLPRLNREERLVLLAALSKIDASRVTWDEIVEGEKSCTRYYIKSHFNPIVWVVAWWNTREAVRKSEMRHKTVMAQEHLLMAELALRSYQSEKGYAPARLEELVPKYLSKVPQDPFSDKPMIYRPQGGGSWLVYSVGPDGLDDGGKPASKGRQVKGDILVDSL
jgi:hypothetical protein